MTNTQLQVRTNANNELGDNLSTCKLSSSDELRDLKHIPFFNHFEIERK